MGKNGIYRLLRNYVYIFCQISYNRKTGDMFMKKGEFWVSNFWDGDHGVLIGDRIESNLWECTYFKKLGGKKYYKDQGGRVTGNPFDDSVYSGEGQVIEDAFSKFYHVAEGFEIVPVPDMIPIMTMKSWKR
jgi:hypothetical protein